MATSTDNWHEAAYAAAQLARHAAIVYGSDRCGGRAVFHSDQADSELRRIARALGYDLVKREAHATVTILPIDPEEEAA